MYKGTRVWSNTHIHTHTHTHIHISMRWLNPRGEVRSLDIRLYSRKHAPSVHGETI